MPRTRVPERLEKRAREIVEALDGTWSRSRGMCCCPAHDDQTPSLSVTIGVRAILFHCFAGCSNEAVRSEEHTSELQSLMRISYAVFCLVKTTNCNQSRSEEH